MPILLGIEDGISNVLTSHGGDFKNELGDWVGPAKSAAGFHLTKKACSVLITTIFPEKQACSLSLVRITFRD